MPKIMISLNNEEIGAMSTSVIVEKYMSIKDGKSRRAYHTRFNKEERDRIHELYKRFYSWELNTGIPRSITFSPKTIKLINSAVRFFGTI